MNRNIFSVILAGGILLSSCAPRDNKSGTTAEAGSGSEAAEPVKVMTVAKTIIARTIDYTATVQAFEEVNMAPSSPGRVDKIYVEVGDRVEKGQNLFLMDRTQYYANKIQLANLEKDLARLDTLLKLGSVKAQTYDQTKAQYEVMKTNVQTIDNAQLWLPLESLRRLAGMEDEATIAIIGQKTRPIESAEPWLFNSPDMLLKDLNDLVKTKTVGASIMYVLLLFLAMLAIFDTQILSVFKRRKEIGTLVALGMTRFSVIKLLTLEGAMHGILAMLLATLYGAPLLFWFSRTGWTFPESMDDYGFSIGNTLFPAYTVALVLGTVALVMIMVTIVSYLPTRRIAKLNPTDALKGKMT